MLRWSAIAGAAVIGAVSLGISPGQAQTQVPGNTAGQPDCRALAGSRTAWVNCMLGQMTMPQRVGEMFMVNAYGTSATDTSPSAVAANQALYGRSISTIADLTRTYHIGGLIYFTWSNGLTSPEQVVGLSNSVQAAALQQQPSDPMLISTDQEEGYIVRIGPPATVFPGNMALGATRSVRLARQNAAITGEELRAMGVNVDNAPVVDVNTNQLNTADGIRSFGDRPDLVADLGSAAVDGYQQGGRVAAAAKHFPGLGDTSTNPDTGVTVSDQTLAQYEAVNFVPFRRAIAAGADEVMVTSIVARKVDPSGLPAVLSPIFVTHLLRDQLGFGGVIVTDAMNAQALDAYPPGEAAIMAINAGDDELLYGQQADPNAPAPMSDFVPAYQAVLHAVGTGQISLARIDQSVVRLLSLKWKLGLASTAYTNPELVPRTVGTPAHYAAADHTARASVTLLRNDQHVLPLAPRRSTKVLLTGYSTTSFPVLQTMEKDFAARGYDPTVVSTGGRCPSDADIANAVAAASNNQLVVVATANVWDTSFCSSPPTGLPQVSLVDALLATGKPVIVCAVNAPYDAAYLQPAPTFVATYDPQPVSVDALVSVLFGNGQPKGRLPVTIRKPPPSTQILYPFGYGLTYRG